MNKRKFKPIPANEKESKLIEAFNELFITYRQNYIWQNKDGTYTNSSVANKKLTDTQVLNHIRTTDTIGIFCGKYTAKFMIFDIDMEEKSDTERKFTVKQIKSILLEIGIAPQFVHTIFSGKKGYHLLILFDGLMPLQYIDSLYNYVLYKLKCSKHQIELRPKNTIGVKLPLSKHKVTDFLCSFLDENFNEISDKYYILNIRRFSKELFIEIIKEMESEVNQQIKIEQKEKQLRKDYKEPDCFKQYTDSKYTNTKAEFLLENGIQFKSSRHNSLLLLAMYYNTQGYNEYEMIELLIDWMSKQDSKYYSTSWENCLKDIEETVKWVVLKNACLSDRKINIEVYDEEIEKIMELPRYNQQVIMYALLCHSKRYATSTGVFYMTREQIVNATTIKSEKTVTRTIRELEELGYMQIVSSAVYKMPNKYNVLIRADENIKQSKIVVKSNIINLSSNYKEILNNKYSKKELRSKLNRMCYERIVA